MSSKRILFVDDEEDIREVEAISMQAVSLPAQVAALLSARENGGEGR